MAVYIGYLASAFLALSLITGNALRFRWLNIFGCISFIVYGIMINALPVLVTNLILLGINVYQLVKFYSFKETFQLVPFQAGDVFIEKFLLFYKKDIDTFFPDFDKHNMEGKICFAVLRDLVIANIFVSKPTGAQEAIVEMDYTIPTYRDYKQGHFIFEKEKEYLRSKGINRLKYPNKIHPDHEKFIKKMGFVKEANGEFVKTV